MSSSEFKHVLISTLNAEEEARRHAESMSKSVEARRKGPSVSPSAVDKAVETLIDEWADRGVQIVHRLELLSCLTVIAPSDFIDELKKIEGVTVLDDSPMLVKPLTLPNNLAAATL